MYTESEFVKAIQTHSNIIHKVTNVYMPDTAYREDLFQEIVLNAWNGIKNFKGEAKFSTWLYRVALNTAITFYRSGKKKPPTIELFEKVENIPDEKIYDETPLHTMYQAITKLSPIDKALVMLYLEDYSYMEIASMMGITANLVGVKMNRIKTKLKVMVQNEP